MKILKSRLRNIVKEEFQKIILEQEGDESAKKMTDAMASLTKSISDTGEHAKNVVSATRDLEIDQEKQTEIENFTKKAEDAIQKISDAFSESDMLDSDLIYEEDFFETIKKIGQKKWAVYPKSGGKRLGTHTSRSKAKKQLDAIEISKQGNKK